MEVPQDTENPQEAEAPQAEEDPQDTEAPQETEEPRIQQDPRNTEVPQETGDPQETEAMTPHLEEQTLPRETNLRTKETPGTGTDHHKPEADNLREALHQQPHLREDHPKEVEEVPASRQDSDNHQEEEHPQEEEDPEDHRTTHHHLQDNLRGQRRTTKFTQSYQSTRTNPSSRNSRCSGCGNGAPGDQR
jgi:hypothetical protein